MESPDRRHEQHQGGEFVPGLRENPGHWADGIIAVQPREQSREENDGTEDDEKGQDTLGQSVLGVFHPLRRDYHGVTLTFEAGIQPPARPPQVNRKGNRSEQGKLAGSDLHPGRRRRGPGNHRRVGKGRAWLHPRPPDVRRPPQAAHLVARESHAKPHSTGPHGSRPGGNRPYAWQPATDDICGRPSEQRSRTPEAESQTHGVEGRHRTDPASYPPHLRGTDLDRHRKPGTTGSTGRSLIQTRNSTGRPGGR